jgi:hypothetical protein
MHAPTINTQPATSGVDLLIFVISIAEASLQGMAACRQPD